MIPRLPYRGVIFDLDGTVYLGERLLPGKARPYAVLGVPHYWLVNIEARRIECYRAEQGEEAVPLLERADRHAESIGFAYGHALVITTLAEGTLLRGDVENATCAADRALALARHQGQRGWEAWTLRVQGEIAAAAGDRVVAEARYRDALALAEELGMRPLQAHCHLGLGRLTGDRDELMAAVELYRTMDMAFWLARAEAELAGAG